MLKKQEMSRVMKHIHEHQTLTRGQHNNLRK
jgi:hypothetical protein